MIADCHIQGFFRGKKEKLLIADSITGDTREINNIKCHLNPNWLFI